MRQCSGWADFNVLMSKTSSLSQFDGHNFAAATQFHHAFPLIAKGYHRVKVPIRAATGVAVSLLAWDTQLRADTEADDSDQRGERAERRDMTDLNAATTRLHEAIGTLEQALQIERKAAADTAQALTVAQDTLAGNTQQLSTMAAAMASAEAAVEADREAAAAAMTEAQQEISSLRAELAEASNVPAPEPDTAEIEASAGYGG